ncbi:hypothetical protein D3C71_1198370 [compost metagenome]
MSLELMPSSRAFCWSISKRTDRSEGSSQSNCVLTERLSARTSAATFSATARTSGILSPLTRNCTWYPTGGPFSSRDSRVRMAGKCSRSIGSSQLASFSRSSTECAVMTNWPKFGVASCWSSGR